MDKIVKRFMPMSCPVCDGMYFSGPNKDSYEEEINEYLSGKIQCAHCGWVYDFDQVENPNLKEGFNELSLIEYKEWYANKVKENPDYDYTEENMPAPIPHNCPVCGEYEFPDELSSDICPICGWEDTGFEEEPDKKPSAYMLSYNEKVAWFKAKRSQNPKYKWHNEKK